MAALKESAPIEKDSPVDLLPPDMLLLKAPDDDRSPHNPDTVPVIFRMASDCAVEKLVAESPPKPRRK